MYEIFNEKLLNALLASFRYSRQNYVARYNTILNTVYQINAGILKEKLEKVWVGSFGSKEYNIYIKLAIVKKYW